MILTLMLAAGLFAAPLPHAEPPWIIELGGYKYPKQAEPPKRKELIIEFQWPKAKPQPNPIKGQYQPVEAQYHDDLSVFWKQWMLHVQVETVDALYVDDLPAYFKQLKKR